MFQEHPLSIWFEDAETYLVRRAKAFFQSERQRQAFAHASRIPDGTYQFTPVVDIYRDIAERSQPKPTVTNEQLYALLTELRDALKRR